MNSASTQIDQTCWSRSVFVAQSIDGEVRALRDAEFGGQLAQLEC